MECKNIYISWAVALKNPGKNTKAYGNMGKVKSCNVLKTRRVSLVDSRPIRS